MPISKKSCPVARMVLILTVISASLPAGNPALMVKSSTVENPTCIPVATGVAATLISVAKLATVKYAGTIPNDAV